MNSQSTSDMNLKMNPYLRVLVVEDWEDDMLLVLRELRRGGYTLDFARVETPAQMQAALDRQAWDIIVADYTLPAFSALEALKLLQRQQQDLDLPFIIVSGTISEETAVAAMKAGAHDYITKGNLARLVPAVERELREAQERQKRREAERALRESEERFRQLAENISESVFWMSDPQAKRLLYVSPAYERIWGRSCESLYANFQEWLEAIHPEDRQRVRDNFFNGALAGGYDEEYRIVRPDGSTHWIRDRGFPIRDTDGEPYRVVGMAEDITARKQAEFEFQQQIQREQLVADMAQDIRQSLNLNEVLSRTVERVREVLNSDRVIIFRFRADWQGEVIMESVGAEWMPILSTTIFDPCFEKRYIEPYRQGRIATTTDIDTEDLEPCYVELLKPFQVKAILVVPILQADNLWGLLIAHQCSAPRQWQRSEIDLLRQLATQVGIAIQQSELYEQTRRELLERQRMQAVLEESEERFRTLSTAAPIGICQTNVHGSCLYTNARWQEMSGLSFEDCLGDGWLRAIHPEDRSALFAAWETYLQGASDCLPDFRLLTPQGEIRWISARVAPIRSATGEIVSYVSIDEDITNRKLAEQKIREQAALLDIASDAIFVRDLDHRILYWNRGAERLYGWQAAEVMDRKANELLQEDAARVSEIIQTLFERGEWRGEICKVTKTGKEVIVEGRWTLVRDEAGQPKSILTVNADTTEKKQLEAQFYRAQRLESIGTLASGIAHDFNNLLTPILAVAQLLPLKIPNLDDQTRKLLSLLEDSAKRGANLVQQVLSFSRGTEGQRVILQIGHLLSDVVNLAQRTFPKSIEISTAIPTRELWTISADTTQIHQVFMNLFVNARDAMPNGGSLAIAAENRHLDRNYARMNLEAQVGSYVVITVSDTGTGIPPEAIERIFDPFFTTKEVGRGTGLGLSTVLGIVKSHGGFIRVYSEVGKGTQFKVFLPAAEGMLNQQTLEEELSRGNGELILIVDDEDMIREITQTALEDCNYRTLLAKDGVEALSLYAERKREIDVVVMDIMMPNLGGLTAIRTLQTLNPQVKIIATSGLPTNRELALSAGIATFLLKPYTLEELLNALHELLQ